MSTTLNNKAPNHLPPPSVKPLDGNANYLLFFKTDFRSYFFLRKWDDNFVLLFIRHHLTGSAAECIIQVTQTQSIKTPTKIFEPLQKFLSQLYFPKQLQTLFKFLHSENIINLAQSLNYLIAKAHNKIKEPQVLNAIK